ncbi:reverse transcriptase domain-containing protein, partial [Listeria welshimeri]|uniref:reverse transcriptase domain-containing protein n=1 Tax=Listeria welshimeri TaxID=1643 RepID=UPI0019E52135
DIIPMIFTGDDDDEFVHDKPSVEAEQIPKLVEPISSSPVEAESDLQYDSAEDVSDPVTEPIGHRYNLRSRDRTCNITNVIDKVEPRTVKEVMNSDSKDLWLKAMQEEIDSFNYHGAWELVDKPADKNVVKNKWIFTLKRDSEGIITRYRARLVAKGFTQRYGDDYTETFSPVVRHSSIRLLLSIAVHLDVQTAFLNGDLKEEIYMNQPEGFITPGNEEKVYRLRKAVYGLKQASRAWYHKVKDVLLSLGYMQC